MSEDCAKRKQRIKELDIELRELNQHMQECSDVTEKREMSSRKIGLSVARRELAAQIAAECSQD